MKRGISFRVNLLFLTVVAAGILSSLFLLYIVTKEFIEKSVMEKLNDAVYAVRYSFDFSGGLKDLDIESTRTPRYKQNWVKLKKVQTSLNVTDIYIMTVDDQRNLVFIYDSSDNPDIRTVSDAKGLKTFIDLASGATLTAKSVGDEEDVFLQVYRKPPKEIARVLAAKDESTYSTGFYTDEFGTFRSVFLPVLDPKSNLVCVIGADYDFKSIMAIVVRVVLTDTINIVLLLSLCFIFMYYFRKNIVKPIEELNKGVRLAANKVWDYQINVKPGNEIGELAKNFNLMSMNLKDSFDKIEEYNRNLTNELYVDRLTGLSNRKQFFEDLEKYTNPVIIMINIDSFHEINDFYGSETGDFILVEMSRRLKSLCLGSYYHLYKMSADQYSIVVDEVMGKPGMEILGIYFSEGVMDYPFVYRKETEIFVSISMGIGRVNKSSLQEASGNYRMALANADRALKQAKMLRKKFVVFDDTIENKKEYQNNIEWSKKIKKAIREDRIVPYFQPIINNRNGKIEKYECLVRLVDEDGKIVLPYYFLNIAKTARLYRYITKIMIDKSFAFFSKNEFEFSVNLSVEDIMDDQTVSYIMGKLNEFENIGDRVVFEFLETENIEEYTEVKQFVEKVKSKGCRIAIDDFGTGYSNFSHVVHLNVDYIKIDSSLIKNINNDRNSLIITKTIANFARELGMKTISEFVHSKEVFDECVKLDIDYSQGFYLGEPKGVLAEELKK